MDGGVQSANVGEGGFAGDLSPGNPRARRVAERWAKKPRIDKIVGVHTGTEPVRENERVNLMLGILALQLSLLTTTFIGPKSQFGRVRLGIPSVVTRRCKESQTQR